MSALWALHGGAWHTEYTGPQGVMEKNVDVRVPLLITRCCIQQGVHVVKGIPLPTHVLLLLEAGAWVVL